MHEVREIRIIFNTYILEVFACVSVKHGNALNLHLMVASNFTKLSPLKSPQMWSTRQNLPA